MPRLSRSLALAACLAFAGFEFRKFFPAFFIIAYIPAPARSGLFFVQNQNSITVAHMAQKIRLEQSCPADGAHPYRAGLTHFSFFRRPPRLPGRHPQLHQLLQLHLLPQLPRTRQARQ